MNGFKSNLRGVAVRATDPLLPASGESGVAFQRTTEHDPDVSLMIRATYVCGINSHTLVSRGAIILC